MAEGPDALRERLLAALRDAPDLSASVSELVFALGPTTATPREVRIGLRTLARSGRVVRVDRDLYALDPDAEVVEDEEPETSRGGVASSGAGGVGADDAADRRRAARTQMLRFVPADVRDAQTMLDELVRGLEVDRPFSDEALEIANSAVAPDGPEAGSTDLTHLPLVTIDGADAMDFDDAVYAEPAPRDTVRLWVAVADVASYVPEDSALDLEARERGCSVYLPRRVYPMLPPHISDDICSLRPDENRRCAWVRMDIAADGTVVDRELGFGVMRSQARMTYDEVQSMLDLEPSERPAAVRESIRQLERARKRLNARRVARGMLDLDLPEPAVSLSPDGRQVLQVEPHPRFDSHRLIEECMLVANETVAEFLVERGWPGIFRVHGEPDRERLIALRPVLREVATGVRIPDEPGPRDLERAINKVAGTPAARVISWLVLRTLPRACYSVEPSLHFGLGTDRYLHFTSPIRRYPDLEVHRVLRRALAANRGPTDIERSTLVERLFASAAASNQGEELQTMAERHSDRMMRALFMLDKVGESFEGIISEVVGFGFFVSITDPYVEGLVPIRTLGDEYFEMVERQAMLVGARSGTRYQVGDPVTVTLAAVDIREAKLTFEVERGGVEGRRVKKSGKGRPPARPQRGRSRKRP